MSFYQFIQAHERAKKLPGKSATPTGSFKSGFVKSNTLI